MDQEKPSYYAIIPADIRYDKNLTANSKLLYGEITSLCNSKGYCWATNKYFADLYEVSVQSVSGWINQLKNCGYIDIEYSNECRKISLMVKENFNTPLKKSLNGIKENFKDNNIEDNSIDNNIDNNCFSRSQQQEEKQTIAEPTAEWSTPKSLDKSNDLPHNTENNPFVFLSDNDREYLRKKYDKCYLPTLRALNEWNKNNQEYRYAAGRDGFERFVQKQGLRRPREDGLSEGSVIARI